jgi:hypothetical protein
MQQLTVDGCPQLTDNTLLYLEKYAPRLNDLFT